MYRIKREDCRLKNEFCKDVVRKSAFTLAETLITLGIIGVVAALTLPTLIQSHFEKQRVTQLKTTVSQLNQSILRLENEYGSIDTWGLANTYQGVDEEGNDIEDFSSNDIFMSRLAKYYTGSKFLKKGELIANVRSLDGREALSPWTVDSDSRTLKLVNGTILSMGYIVNCTPETKNACASFWIVFPSKKEHMLGVDVFVLDLYPYKGTLPNGWNSRIGNLAPKCSKFSSNIVASGADRVCTAWVYYNENMDYLHCDDLNWQTKRKCK